MDVKFDAKFMAQLAKADAEDPAFAKALRELMAKMHQAAEGAADSSEMLTALERLGVEVTDVDDD